MAREDQLTTIGNQLTTLLNNNKKNNLTFGKFLTGLALLAITTVGSFLIFFGSLKNEVSYLKLHAKDPEIHVMADTRAILESYVQHKEDKNLHMPLSEGIKIFAQKKDLDKLETRVDKLENKK